jgi:hypothetical protein
LKEIPFASFTNAIDMKIERRYLSSSEAYTNNWDLFGKENYLTFDW